MQTYSTLYSVADKGVDVFPLLFTGLWIAVAAIQAVNPRLLGQEKPLPNIARWGLLAFGIIIGGCVIAGDIFVASKTKRWLVSGRYRVVEGAVEKFTPENYMQKKPESFSVGNVSFSYFSHLDYGGYKTPEAFGGVIKPGERVRITYHDNVILKIELPD